jgi:benzoyl-CoA reductase/2-hydroxyglutaryl-CoA dehydratase subunit BcrC/BadD/HgdB
MSHEKSAIKKIRSTGAMRDVMGEYFLELDEASRTGSAKVAWCTSVGPAELLRSFGFRVYFPENHGALLGSSRMAADLIPAATAVGYSPDICSYLTSDIGSFLSKTTPLTKAFGIESVPKPDVLVYNTNQCRDVQDWLAFYQREFGVPLIGIETPRSVSAVSREMTDGLIAQEKALIPTLEEVSGVSFDLDRLKEVTASSYRCTLLWKKVLRIAEVQPSPITFFDGTIHMGPAVVLRGDERAERYYDVLLAELSERVDHSVGAVDDEAYRLYWEGMPVWGKLRSNAEQFADLRGSGQRRSVRRDGPRLHRALHSSLRGLQGALHGGDGQRLQDRRHHLSQRKDLSQQLELQIRHATPFVGATRGSAHRHRRRPQ